MKVEELLKPRYKVIAPWPDADYEVGDIIQLTDGGGECDEFYSTDEDGKFLEWERFYLTFPHLFKKLEWWEERKPEDMPECVRYTGTIDGFKKVFKYFDTIDSIVDYIKRTFKQDASNHFLPATKEEYEACLTPTSSPKQ